MPSKSRAHYEVLKRLVTLDYSKIDLGKGGKVRLKGIIKKFYNPVEHNVKPMAKCYTVTLLSGKKTYYLKFKEKEERDKCMFVEDESAVVEGHLLPPIDNKNVVTEVKRVPDTPIESL